MACQGRLVSDKQMLRFDDGGTGFHIPLACSYAAKMDGLCTACFAREERTRKIEQEMTGMTVKGATHPSLLHGRINGPIPFWSHVFNGAWFNLKIEEGYTVSEETMARARKAVQAAGDTEAVATPIPEAVKKRVRKPKAEGSGATGSVAPVQKRLEFPVVEPPAMAAVASAAAAAPEAPAPPTPLKKRSQPKKAAKASTVFTPTTVATAFVDTTKYPEPVEDVIHIKVKKVEIDGRSLYMDSKKQKLYDLKFKYVGRYDSKKQSINSSFPDSDAE